jgi:hypothetical protein
VQNLFPVFGALVVEDFFAGARQKSSSASAKISILTETRRVSPLQGLDTVFTVGYPGRCHWAIEFLRLWRARGLGRDALAPLGSRPSLHGLKEPVLKLRASVGSHF